MPLDNTSPLKSEAVWRVEMLGGLRALPLRPSEPCHDGDGSREDSAEGVERFRTHNAALLLARLALFSQRSHAREELADLLWPDTSTERGRANLTQTLVYLRQALHEPRAGGLFIADHQTVWVSRGQLQTDVAEWMAAAVQALAASPDHDQAALLSAALDKYKGDLLPGFYSDWICDERSRLTALRDSLQARLQTLSEASDLERTPQPKAAPFAPRATDLPTLLNAPLYLTRVFGRDAELTGALQLLRQAPPVRLLTLLGMGGIGKTRLALEISRTALQGDGEVGESHMVFGWAAFVSLAEARTSVHLESILLRALAVKSRGTDGLADIIDYLKERAGAQATDPRTANRILLVLDNLEQLGDAVTSLMARLLTEVPALTVLATSRRPVRIPGEQEIHLGPLSGSTSGAKGNITDDVRLFVDRARLVRPQFALTPKNGPVIARLCALLEGIPLALELAAAWMRVLSPSQVADRLHDRFGVLFSQGTFATNSVPERHRSLRAMIAWSYDLLEPPLQTFFTQLSVFHGGWTAEAAQVITGIDDVYAALLLLAERFLVQVEEDTREGNEPPRYRMLESLREYALLQAKPLQNEAMEKRHAAYFLGVAQAGEAALRGPEQAAWLDRLEAEHDNFRAALAGLTAGGNADDSQKLAGALWGFWSRRGYLAEGRESLERALSFPSASDRACRALALNRLGAILCTSDNLEEAAAVHGEALTISERLDDVRGIALAWNLLGVVAGRRGDIDAAQYAFTEALARERELGNQFNIAAAAVNLGVLAQSRRAYATARAYYEESLGLFHALGNPGGVADTLLNLADMDIKEERWAEARTTLLLAQTEYEGLNDRWGCAYITFGFALLARYENEWDKARRLAEEALAVCVAVGDRVKTADIHCHLAVVALHHGDKTAALAYLDTALTLYRAIGKAESVAACEQQISAAHSPPELG